MQEPTAITFTLTKWYLQLVDSVVSHSDSSQRRDLQALAEYEIELIILEIL